MTARELSSGEHAQRQAEAAHAERKAEEEPKAEEELKAKEDAEAEDEGSTPLREPPVWVRPVQVPAPGSTTPATAARTSAFGDTG